MQEEVLRNRLRKALDSVPVQYSLIVKVSPEDFAEEDVLPLATFVNERLRETDWESLPAQVRFGRAEITLRRYTVEIAHSPRIAVMTE